MIGRRYGRYVSQTYLQTGTLRERRFKSQLVDSDAYLLACSRYIVLNPVRAGMVEMVQRYLIRLTIVVRLHGDSSEHPDIEASGHPRLPPLASCTARQRRPVTIVSMPRRVPVPS